MHDLWSTYRKWWLPKVAQHTTTGTEQKILCKGSTWFLNWHQMNLMRSTSWLILVNSYVFFLRLSLKCKWMLMRERNTASGLTPTTYPRLIRQLCARACCVSSGFSCWKRQRSLPSSWIKPVSGFHRRSTRRHSAMRRNDLVFTCRLPPADASHMGRSGVWRLLYG